jgi:hypothetical protein
MIDERFGAAVMISLIKKREKNAWITVDCGTVCVTMGDSYAQSFSKPFGFSLPDEFPEEDGGALAHFTAGCLAKCGVAKGGVALLLGEGVAFYEGYEVNPENTRLRSEQRDLAIERAVEGAAGYIVEDLKVADVGGLSILAVCGARYEFLSEFAKILRKHGYLVMFASHLGAARAVRAAVEARTAGGADASPQAPPFASYKAIEELPDFLYGGRENRRFGRVTTVLCACAVAVAVALALFPPVQAGIEKSDASRYIAQIRGADGSYYEMLERYRQLQRRLPGIREGDKALDKSETQYGALLEYLRSGLLREGVVDSVKLSEDDGLTIEYTTGDIKAFEAEKQRVNLSREMSVGETGERVRVGTGEKETWRVTIKVAYYSFAGGEDAYQ